MDFLAWLDTSALGVWVRESPSLLAYPGILTLHTLGMGMLVGANMAVDLRLLGFAPRIPLAPLERLFPIMWVSFWINALTGVLLFISEASKKGSQSVFFVKLLLVGLGVINIRLLKTQVFRDLVGMDSGIVSTRGKLLAGTSLAIWTGAITAGRLMAYL